MDYRARLMPTLAILWHDLGSLFSSWLVRGWLILSGLLVFFQVAGTWRELDDGNLIASILFPYLMVWYLIVVMLGVGPVASGRSESLADGILSRPVTRYEYLFASWAARVITVLAVFLVIVVPAILLTVTADRPAPENPVTLYGVSAAVCVVCLVLTLQVSLAFLLGTLLRRQLVAVALLAMGWLISAAVLNSYKLEELSPISLAQAMPKLLTQSWSEEPESELTEEEEFSKFFKPVGNVFGFASPPTPNDTHFADSKYYEDVALWRVALGYGLTTLLSIGLATLVFCRRDL